MEAQELGLEIVVIQVNEREILFHVFDEVKAKQVSERKNTDSNINKNRGLFIGCFWRAALRLVDVRGRPRTDQGCVQQVATHGSPQDLGSA